MKFILRLIIIALASFFFPFYLPWWSVVILAGVTCFLIPGSTINAFITGFLGAGIVWLGLSFKLDLDSSAVLSEKIVMLFPFSDATYLIIASGVVGALCGGLGAITGNSFRQIFIKKKGRGFYEA